MIDRAREKSLLCSGQFWRKNDNEVPFFLIVIMTSCVKFEVKDKNWESARMAVYAAQIDRMDQDIGRIIAKLRELKIEKNTLVIFLSDNGGCAEFLKEDGEYRYECVLPRTREGRLVRCGNIPEFLRKLKGEPGCTPLLIH